MINIESFYTEFFKPGNVTSDSRHIIENGIFIALKGENFNGNTFANEAIKLGASVAIVDEAEFQNNKNILLVDNTLKFLQQLSTYHRKKIGVKVIAITGTNGKTTTKELIKSVLTQEYKCQATVGNLNNHIGVPLTLLSLSPETQYAIIEMGANHPGEISLLCNIALPDFGLITNIGKAHLEGFGSFEGVIKTKSELYNYIKSTDGQLFYNATNPILKELINNYDKVSLYNSNESISAKVISISPTLEIEISFKEKAITTIRSNLYGSYNLENILSAACIGYELGIDIEKIKAGIEKYIPENNRSQVVNNESNTLILDCYNANPTSMYEAISSFGKIINHSKVVILGGMKELGQYSEEEHKKVIELLKLQDFEEVLLTGEEFELPDNNSYKYFKNLEALIEYLNHHRYKDKYILIKGSRANKLEKIVGYLN